jgi:hypothetical protein
MPTRPILTVCATALAGVALGACSGSSPAKVVSPPAPTPTTTAATSATSATTVENTARECGASEANCTPAQVIATVTRYYLVGAGATRTEAACIAHVFGKDTHAVNEAFGAPTAAQNQAAIACVGTEARARVLVTALAKWFGAHPNGT